jgi:hypothetical protein
MLLVTILRTMPQGTMLVIIDLEAHCPGLALPITVQDSVEQGAIPPRKRRLKLCRTNQNPRNLKRILHRSMKAIAP